MEQTGGGPGQAVGVEGVVVQLVVGEGVEQRPTGAAGTAMREKKLWLIIILYTHINNKNFK